MPNPVLNIDITKLKSQKLESMSDQDLITALGRPAATSSVATLVNVQCDLARYRPSAADATLVQEALREVTLRIERKDLVEQVNNRIKDNTISEFLAERAGIGGGAKNATTAQLAIAADDVSGELAKEVACVDTGSQTQILDSIDLLTQIKLAPVARIAERSLSGAKELESIIGQDPQACLERFRSLAPAQNMATIDGKLFTCRLCYEMEKWWRTKKVEYQALAADPPKQAKMVTRFANAVSTKIKKDKAFLEEVHRLMTGNDVRERVGAAKDSEIPVKVTELQTRLEKVINSKALNYLKAEASIGKRELETLQNTFNIPNSAQVKPSATIKGVLELAADVVAIINGTNPKIRTPQEKAIALTDFLDANPKAKPAVRKKVLELLNLVEVPRRERPERFKELLLKVTGQKYDDLLESFAKGKVKKSAPAGAVLAKPRSMDEVADLAERIIRTSKSPDACKKRLHKIVEQYPEQASALSKKLMERFEVEMLKEEDYVKGGTKLAKLLRERLGRDITIAIQNWANPDRSVWEKLPTAFCNVCHWASPVLAGLGGAGVPLLATTMFSTLYPTSVMMASVTGVVVGTPWIFGGLACVGVGYGLFELSKWITKKKIKAEIDAMGAAALTAWTTPEGVYDGMDAVLSGMGKWLNLGDKKNEVMKLLGEMYPRDPKAWAYRCEVVRKKESERTDAEKAEFERFNKARSALFKYTDAVNGDLPKRSYNWNPFSNDRSTNLSNQFAAIVQALKRASHYDANKDTYDPIDLDKVAMSMSNEIQQILGNKEGLSEAVYRYHYKLPTFATDMVDMSGGALMFCGRLFGLGR